MALILSDADVQWALPVRGLADALQAALTPELALHSVLPQRMNLSVDQRFLRVMPAMLPTHDIMGLKIFLGGPGAGIRYLVLLARMSSGEIVACLDARHLTAARTAATSVVAARRLEIKTRKLAVLGSGLEAAAHCRAFAAEGDLESIAVYSPRQERREALAGTLAAELGVPVTAAASAEAACDGVDHLVTATNTGANGPVACRSDWIAPGTYVSAIGSTSPELRELETSVFKRADLLVFDTDPEQVINESGDLVAFREENGDLSHVALLDELCEEHTRLASAPDRDLVIFKSVGTAAQDLAAAWLAYTTASAVGVGMHIAEPALPKTKG